MKGTLSEDAQRVKRFFSWPIFLRDFGLFDRDSDITYERAGSRRDYFRFGRDVASARARSSTRWGLRG